MSVSQIRGGMGNITNFGRIVAKRVKDGLYAGRNVKHGNNVSEDGGNKTRRTWKPNSHRKRLYSEVLDRLVSVNVTAHALRCIDKAGGLDRYILDTPVRKLAVSGDENTLALNLRKKMKERQREWALRDEFKEALLAEKEKRRTDRDASA